MNLQELKTSIDRDAGLFWENLSDEIAACLPVEEAELPALSNEFIEILNSGTAVSMLSFLLAIGEADILTTLGEMCTDRDTTINLNDLINEVSNE